MALAVVSAACTKGEQQKSDTAQATAALHTVGGTRIAFPHAGPPGEWQMPAGDYSNSRYSELSTITPANAANLHVSWTFSTGVLRGHEGQPLVIGNTMYIITPYPTLRTRWT
jgi:glucose dehydrogenase